MLTNNSQQNDLEIFVEEVPDQVQRISISTGPTNPCYSTVSTIDCFSTLSTLKLN